MGWWNLQRKEEWLFRGQICSKWTFQTSLERAIISFGTATKRIPNKSDADYENKLAVLHREILGAGLENYNVSNLEKGLLRRFMRQSHHYVTTLPSEENVMEWLALMQHYGAPTCLLDWTHSLFVAVYFAVEQADSECAVWALNLKWVERTIYDVLDKVASEALKEDRNVTKKETFKQVFDHGHGLVCPIKPYRFNERFGVTPIDWTVKRAKLERGEEFLGSIFFSLLRRFVFPFSVVFRHAVEKRLSHLPYNARSHTG